MANHAFNGPILRMCSPRARSSEVPGIPICQDRRTDSSRSGGLVRLAASREARWILGRDEGSPRVRIDSLTSSRPIASGEWGTSQRSTFNFLQCAPLPHALPGVARYERCAVLTIDGHSRAFGRTTSYPARPIIAPPSGWASGSFNFRLLTFDSLGWANGSVPR